MIRMMKLLVDRIKHCYKQLVRQSGNRHTDLYEALRNRLDELILYYSSVRRISFIEACKETNVEYKYVDCVESEA